MYERSSLETTAPITFVRPGPRALAWLVGTVRELKAADPLEPVTVIAPNFNAARLARWRLAERGGFAGVKTVLLGQLAERLAAEDGAGRGRLGPVLEVSAVRAALQRSGGQLGRLAHHPSLIQALADLFRELRRREHEPADLADWRVGPVAAEALACYAEYRRLTAELDDGTAVRQRAERRLREAASAPVALRDLGGLVLFLPPRLDAVDVRLLAAANRWVPLRAAFPRLDDPTGRGDRLARTAAERLADALRVPRLEPETAARPEVDLRVIRAPEPAEEVREVIRRIAADLEAEPGVPLHRVAVLYRQTRPYAALVREALDLAEIRWSALEGRSLAESRPGRALLSLLHLPEARFGREALLDWLDSAPLGTGEGAPPVPTWDRLSRAAGVVRGADQWVERLESLAGDLEAQAERRGREGHEPLAAALHHQAEEARAIAARVGAISHGLEAPPNASRWGELVDWAEDLWARFIGGPAVWPAEERPFAEDVAAALAGLREADRFESSQGVTLAAFGSTLRAALEAASRPVGRLGQGVLVGPVQAITGLEFARVYLLGLTEGTFPPAPAADPFFPREADDPLGRREQQRNAERQAFLTALSAAEGGVVVLSTTDSDGGRAAFPSRWLLEVVSPRCAEPLYTANFRSLTADGRPWLRVIPSAQDGLEGAASPADLEDRRLKQAACWRAAGRPLAEHGLARRTELPLGRALGLRRARQSDAFTAFDGNLAELSGARSLREKLDGRRPISASAVEQWAICPFRYFLGRVLGVEPTPQPEETWTIDPLERGSLVHEILERFFSELSQRERPMDGQPYDADDLRLLEGIAARSFAHSQARGRSGHPLVWENAQAAILADLRAFLREDTVWRQKEGFGPALFEQGFGTGEAEAWPAVELALGEASLRFRGYIDRVDRSADGRRAFVFDYKTGSDDDYRGLEEDPVLGGRHVQLAVYTEAVRNHLGNHLEVGGAFWFVSRKAGFRRRGLPCDSARVEQRLAEVLEMVAGGIRDGHFPQVPGEDDGQGFPNCRFCDYDRICPSGRDELYRRKRGHYRLSGGEGGEVEA